MNKNKLTFNAVLVVDPHTGGYTGFFEEFPQAVAEGETEKEVLNNLAKAMSVMMEFNKEDVEEGIMTKISEFGTVKRMTLDVNYEFA